jgi:lipid-binding SYLF domain-containing protein
LGSVVAKIRIPESEDAMNSSFLAALVAAAISAPAPSVYGPPPARELEEAVEVLDELTAIPLKGIPPKLLADAHGVVIVPRVVKVGFLVGVRGGRGVALQRNSDGTWGEPVFVRFGGASVGFQAGVEATDVILVFRSRRSLDRVLAGKEKLTLGADATVAAGPLGREALAATDARMKAEVLSYSRSRGLFAGVSLDGAVIQPDPEQNAAFRKHPTADELKWAKVLQGRLAELSATKPVPAAGAVPPVLGPPVQPPRPRFPRLRWRPFRRPA